MLSLAQDIGIYCNDKVRQMPNILELPDTQCCFVSFLFFPDYVRMFGGVVHSVGSFWAEGREVGDGDFVLECAVTFLTVLFLGGLPRHVVSSGPLVLEWILSFSCPLTAEETRNI